ncbi:MAG: hypothetical protein ACE5JP_08425 [Candidatus Bipolaricaulia bacterium]
MPDLLRLGSTSCLIVMVMMIASVSVSVYSYDYEEFESRMLRVIQAYYPDLFQMNPTRPVEIIRGIWGAWEQTGVDPWLLAAVCARENEFRNRPGAAGEVGYCQMMSETIRVVGRLLKISTAPETFHLRVDLQFLFAGTWLQYNINNYGLLEGIARYNHTSHQDRYVQQVLRITAAFRYSDGEREWLFYNDPSLFFSGPSGDDDHLM